MVKVRRSKTARIRRKTRVRGKVYGTSSRPRLSVFRSAKHVFVQLIDDDNGKTLVSASDAGGKGASKTEQAFDAGREIAKRAAEKKIKKIIFDRGGYAYKGRIKAVAEGAREGGLEF